MYYDVRSDLILFDIVKCLRVEPVRADFKKRRNSLEAEKVVHLCSR